MTGASPLLQCIKNASFWAPFWVPLNLPFANICIPRHWTGTSLQLRLKQGQSFQIKIILIAFQWYSPHKSPLQTVVPVQYQDNLLFLILNYEHTNKKYARRWRSVGNEQYRIFMYWINPSAISQLLVELTKWQRSESFLWCKEEHSCNVIRK